MLLLHPLLLILCYYLIHTPSFVPSLLPIIMIDFSKEVKQKNNCRFTFFGQYSCFVNALFYNSCLTKLNRACSPSTDTGISFNHLTFCISHSDTQLQRFVINLFSSYVVAQFACSNKKPFAFVLFICHSFKDVRIIWCWGVRTSFILVCADVKCLQLRLEGRDIFK